MGLFYLPLYTTAILSWWVNEITHSSDKHGTSTTCQELCQMLCRAIDKKKELASTEMAF